MNIREVICEIFPFDKHFIVHSNNEKKVQV